MKYGMCFLLDPFTAVYVSPKFDLERWLPAAPAPVGAQAQAENSIPFQLHRHVRHFQGLGEIT